MSFLVRFGRLIIKSNNTLFNIDQSISIGKNNPCLLNFISLSSHRNFAGLSNNFKSFDDSVSERRCQAKRSVLVQVNSELSFPELHSYCSQFGTVVGVHHYSIHKKQQHFMLVEFQNEEEANRLMSSCCYAQEMDVIPVRSSFLWFRPHRDKRSFRVLTQMLTTKPTPEPCQLTVENGCEIKRDEVVLDKIKKCNSVSEQIETLFQMTCLNDLGIRLRFIVAKQIESALFGMCPDVSVIPFGSSVNGFGKMGCDLDLLLRLSSNNDENNSSSRLVFHTKKSTSSSRSQQQKYMELIGDMIELFVPGCSHIRRILQARIPIIKYNQDYAGVECDLSMASMSGVYMSELLYMYGCLDPRVRPLVFTVRKWAQCVGLTNPSPGRWITNFPLTLMVIFYLQNIQREPILPSYNHLQKIADESDIRITEDQINCTFVRDASKIGKSSNTNTLEQLLIGFFEFYAAFDFVNKAISINQGKEIAKPDYSALYIVNPLETGLNVSKNVSFEECERLKIEVRNAAWQLDSSEPTSSKCWGLTGIFQFQEMFMPVVKGTSRLVSVKDLFTDNEQTDLKNNDNFDNLKRDIVSMVNKNRHMDSIYFRNDAVKREIADARRKNEQEMKRQNILFNNVTGKDNNSNVSVRRKTRRR